jgi:hypothetical protein
MTSRILMLNTAMTALVSLALVGIAAPMQAQISITTCPYMITAPGNYAVGMSLSCGSGESIYIESSNVQLTLNGHTITGPGGLGGNVGIAVDPLGVGLSGIQIQGPGLVENFNIGIDINQNGGNDNNIQISKVTAAFNVYGLLAANVTGLQLQQSVFANNSTYGVLLENSTNARSSRTTQAPMDRASCFRVGAGTTCRITPPTGIAVAT